MACKKSVPVPTLKGCSAEVPGLTYFNLAPAEQVPLLIFSAEKDKVI